MRKSSVKDSERCNKNIVRIVFLLSLSRGQKIQTGKDNKDNGNKK